MQEGPDGPTDRQRKKCPRSKLVRDNLCLLHCCPRSASDRDQGTTRGMVIGLKDVAPFRSPFANSTFPLRSFRIPFLLSFSLFNLLLSFSPWRMQRRQLSPPPPCHQRPPQICTTKAFCLPPSNGPSCNRRGSPRRRRRQVKFHAAAGKGREGGQI